MILTGVAADAMGFMVLKFRPYIAERFSAWGHVWDPEIMDAGGYQLSVTGAREETSGGALLTRVVRALSEGEELFALPVSRYEEARP